MPISRPDRFAARFEAVRGIVHRVSGWNSAAECVARICADEGAGCVALGTLPSEFLTSFERTASGIPTILRPPYAFDSLPGAIDNAEIGIAAADFAIAETGTLVEIALDDALRLVSSLPRTYVGIVPSSAFVDTLSEAAPLIRTAYAGNPTNCVVSFISGPSRTGDIEMILTLGVHGPEIAHAVIVDDVANAT